MRYITLNFDPETGARCAAHVAMGALLAVTLGLVGCGNQTPEAFVAAAKAELAKGNNAAAVIELKNALQLNQTLPEARLLLGKALLANGDANSAVLELRKAQDLKASNEELLPVLARALIVQGQFKKMTDEFGAVNLPSRGPMADLLTSLAVAHAAQGQTEQADAKLKSALLADPTFAPAMILLARHTANRGNFEEALRLIESTVVAHPGLPEPWQFKGDLLFLAKKDTAAAVASYERALSFDKQSVAAHTGIISISLKDSDIAAATKQVARLKAALPNHPQTQYFEALLAVERRDFAAAKSLTELLLKSAPNYSRALVLAGTIELQSGSLLQAEKHFVRVLQGSPDHARARLLLAQTYIRLGQAGNALSTLSPLLENGPPDARTLILAARAHLDRGDAANADVLFRRAADLKPTDVASRTGLALSALAKGNVGEGIAELRETAASDSGTTADLALVSALLQRKEFDAALTAIDSLRKKMPEQAMPFALQGRTHILRQDLASARESFKRALEIDPLYFAAIDSMAALDLSEGKPDRAMERFDKLLEADPKNMQALLSVASLKSAKGGKSEEVTATLLKAVKLNPTEVVPRLLLTEDYIRNKDYKLALASAQDGVATVTDNPRLIESMGRVQLASGDLNQAVQTLTRLISLVPRSAQPHMLLAEAYVSQKNVDAAIRSLKRALEVAPDSLLAEQRLIALELSRGDTGAARKVAQAVQKRRGSEAIGHLFEGDVEAAVKNWEAAATAYRAGLKKQPLTDLAVKLHRVLLDSDQTAEAAKFARGWRAEHPQDTPFVFHLGEVALKQENYATAEKHYLEVLAVNPKDVAALNNVAWVIAKQKKAGAVAYAQRANELQPGQAFILDTLSFALAEDNQLEKAIATQRQIIDLQPKNNAMRLTLAKLYLKSRDNARAKVELEQLARLGPAFAEQAEVTQLLRSL